MENKVAQRSVLFITLPILLLFFQSCIPPLAHVFEDVEDGIYLEKTTMVNAPAPDSSVKVMTWNIRFGIGRGPWFGDACGYKVVYSEAEILANMTKIAQKSRNFSRTLCCFRKWTFNPRVQPTSTSFNGCWTTRISTMPLTARNGRRSTFQATGWVV